MLLFFFCSGHGRFWLAKNSSWLLAPFLLQLRFLPRSLSIHISSLDGGQLPSPIPLTLNMPCYVIEKRDQKTQCPRNFNSSFLKTIHTVELIHCFVFVVAIDFQQGKNVVQTKITQRTRSIVKIMLEWLLFNKILL